MRDNAKGGALTEVTFFILLSLYTPKHGYAVMQFIEDSTKGRLTLGAGTLYGALNSLQEKGWIAPFGDSAGRKKEYLITTQGKEIAEKENCVIVGRCSDYILRDRKDALHVFIYADLDNRSKRILERYGESDKPILKRIEDKDASRKIYYSHYTDRPWGVPQNYHVSLSSSALGEDACVNTIVNLFRECDG